MESLIIDYESVVSFSSFDNIKLHLCLYCLSRRKGGLLLLVFKEDAKLFDSFARQELVLTKKVHQYNQSIIEQYKLDAIIVGSDYVWRPTYSSPALPCGQLRLGFGLPAEL